MKKITLALLVMLAFCWQSNAQATYYAFSESTGNTFTSISATGTALSLTDDSKALVDLGFTFPYSLLNYTQVSVSSNGYLRMGDVEASNAFNTLAGTGVYLDLVGPFWEDLNPSDGGAIYHETSGTAPNRTFILEYNAVPRYNGPATVTVQAVLYEGTGNIEFKYGTSSTGFVSASIGVTMTPGGTDNYIGITPGSPATSSSTVPNDGITESPADGVNYLLSYTPPSCLPPSALSVANITSTTADLAWTVGDSETLWDIEIVDITATATVTGTATDTGVTNPFTQTGLSPNNTYEFYVRADCGGSQSSWVGPFSFTTACVTLTAPYSEDFENAGALPDCWASTSSTTREWSFATSPTNGNSYADNTSGTGYFALVDASTTAVGSDITLTSPFIDVSGLSVPALEFFVHHFVAGDTDSNTINVDVWDGAAWNNVYSDDNGDVDGWQAVNIDLSALTITGDVQARFVIDTETTPNFYNDIAIDDVSFGELPSSVPVCATNLVATPDACGNFDTVLTWDSVAGATGYVLSVGTTTGGTDIIDNQDVATALTFSIPSLVGADYFWTIVPYNIVGSAAGCAEETFTSSTTGCYCDSTTASVDGDGISNLQIDATDFASGGVLGYEDFTGAPVDLAQGVTSNVQITFATGYSYGVNIWIDFNDDFNFDAGELLFTGEETTAAVGVVFDASFIMPASAALGTHRMRIVTDDSVGDAADSCNSTTWHVTMDVDVNIIMASCSPVVATAVVSADCANTQFFIDVDITDLGDGTPELSDGTNTFPINALGVLQVGPYADASTVTLSITHGSDVACDFGLGDFSNTCPPANDLCSNAIVLTAGSLFETNPLIGTNAGATGSGELPLPGCAQYDPADPLGFGGDLWYAVTVPSDGNLTIETSANPIGNGGDSGMAVYSGTCGALALVDCDDDGSPDGAYSQVVITPTEALENQVVYVRVWEYGGNASMEFQVSAYSATLDVNTFENEAAFSYYPNPVKNTLTLNAQNTIENVVMYNMLGQVVLRATPKAVDSNIDMSNLQTGAYFVQVTIANVTETIRVIKQ